MYLCACIEGVAIDSYWVWQLLNEGATHICSLENGSSSKMFFFYESFWRYFLCRDAISYQCILKQERKVSTSVILTISLIRYHNMGPLDKGVKMFGDIYDRVQQSLID